MRGGQKAAIGLGTIAAAGALAAYFGDEKMIQQVVESARSVAGPAGALAALGGIGKVVFSRREDARPEQERDHSQCRRR